MASDEDIVRSYLSGDSDQQFSAWEDIAEALEENPARAFALISLAVRRSSSDWQLTKVGAGPLEEFMYKHGLAFVSELTALARENPHNFGTAYRVMYLDDIPGPVCAAVDDALRSAGVSARNREP